MLSNKFALMCHLLVIILCAVVPNVAASTSVVTLAASAYPSHGLPAVPPAFVVTVANGSSRVVTLTSATFCIEMSDSGTPCNVSDGYDWNTTYLGSRQAGPTGVVSIQPTQTLSFYGDAPEVFFERQFLTPKTYSLRLRLVSEGLVSNAFTYTVDQPTGENGAVWSVMQQVIDGHPYYFTPEMEETLAAHPTSVYAKIAALTTRTVATHGSADAVSLALSDVALQLPEAIDTALRIRLALEYQIDAKFRARAGLLDSAVQQADLGLAILNQLRAGANAFAAGAANAVANNGPWTRTALDDYAAFAKGTRLDVVKPLTPTLKCVSVPGDGTFTATFSVQNPNSTPVDMPRGTENAVSPPPADQGQPVRFIPGTQDSVFGATAPVGTTITWTLGIRTVSAQSTNPRRCTPSKGP